MGSFFLGLPGLIGLGAFVIAVATGLGVPRAHTANIIGFADNATSCGGATLCATNGTATTGGTLGYNGSNPFSLSTITSWFQIDSCSGSNSNCSAVGGVSLLAGQPAQTMNSGDFLVVNNTGAVLTSFSLTLNDSFTNTTSGASGSPPTENFQIHGGAANYFTNLTLTGPDCVAACATVSANFTAGTITYNWSAGTDAGIPVGATFDLNFASWNNDVSAVTAVPEPSTWAMMLLGIAGLGFVASRRRRKSSTAVAIA